VFLAPEYKERPAELEQVHHPDDEQAADRQKQKFGTEDSRHGCAPRNGWQGRALAGERALVGLGGRSEIQSDETKRISITHASSENTLALSRANAS
jgi:hypothetical protein